MKTSDLPSLDMPHWARRAVKDMRARLDLPPAITDRQIYAALASGGPTSTGVAATRQRLLTAAQELSHADPE